MIKGVSEKVENVAKKQKVGFLNILLGTWGVSLLQNLIASKATIRIDERETKPG